MMIRPILCLCFQTTAFRTQLKYVQGRRIIDKDGRLCQLLNTLGIQLLHLIFFHLTARDLFEPNLTFGARGYGVTSCAELISRLKKATGVGLGGYCSMRHYAPG